ncbi:sulfur carrier protein ThiS [Butyrivibrio sp. INlla21]|uniref:sulfur carrier protein ThiS n=1 Tax=Butyrivibrio sp. INlla21 TaxID=1520811 RepID=UPI0008DF54DC|nr:sulfur carrier protein ThiS [Butyrivibrio sp. INlla21]SFU93456.1 sulfur carrier protein [Butyrivibrio sp. INlla21]
MVKINGKEYQYENKQLSAILSELNYDRERVAVEINEEIVPKVCYDITILKDGDIVEVVSFVGGG